MVRGFSVRVECFVFRVYGVRFCLRCGGCRLGLRVEGLGFRVQG